MKTKITTSVVIILTTIFCVMCNMACSNSSSSQSSSRGDGTTATVYSYLDGTELYVLYDDGRARDSRSGSTGVWNWGSVMIGPNEIYYKEITFNGYDPVCAITYEDGKVYWGSLVISNIKADYPNGQQLKSRRR